MNELVNPVLSREYLPIQQVIEEYSKMLTNYFVYHEQFPNSPHCRSGEAKAARDNLVKYANILVDEKYPQKFATYYAQALSLFDIELDLTTSKENTNISKCKK